MFVSKFAVTPNFRRAVKLQLSFFCESEDIFRFWSKPCHTLCNNGCWTFYKERGIFFLMTNQRLSLKTITWHWNSLRKKFSLRHILSCCLLAKTPLFTPVRNIYTTYISWFQSFSRIKTNTIPDCSEFKLPLFCSFAALPL